jgi:hypothetical protein
MLDKVYSVGIIVSLLIFISRSYGLISLSLHSARIVLRKVPLPIEPPIDTLYVHRRSDQNLHPL